MSSCISSAQFQILDISKPFGLNNSRQCDSIDSSPTTSSLNQIVLDYVRARQSFGSIVLECHECAEAQRQYFYLYFGNVAGRLDGLPLRWPGTQIVLYAIIAEQDRLCN